MADKLGGLPTGCRSMPFWLIHLPLLVRVRFRRRFQQIGQADGDVALRRRIR